MNDEVHFVHSKSQEAITHEWDLIAPARDDQLASDSDLSFTDVLQPWIVDRLGTSRTIADVGCGTGRLTSRIRRTGRTVVGIDPSRASIEIARSHDPGGHYEASTLEDWVLSNPQRRVDLVVANMVLMDVISLDRFCIAMSGLLKGGGRAVLTITHPAFWPFYWGYSSNQGFDYSEVITVEAPFRTSTRKYRSTTTHIHRPISDYVNALAAAGLKITEFEELRGTEAPQRFPFPRFLALEVTAT